MFSVAKQHFVTVNLVRFMVIHFHSHLLIWKLNYLICVVLNFFLFILVISTLNNFKINFVQVFVLFLSRKRHIIVYLTRTTSVCNFINFKNLTTYFDHHSLLMYFPHGFKVAIFLMVIKKCLALINSVQEINSVRRQNQM